MLSCNRSLSLNASFNFSCRENSARVLWTPVSWVLVCKCANGLGVHLVVDLEQPFLFPIAGAHHSSGCSLYSSAGWVQSCCAWEGRWQGFEMCLDFKSAGLYEVVGNKHCLHWNSYISSLSVCLCHSWSWLLIAFAENNEKKLFSSHP